MPLFDLPDDRRAGKAGLPADDRDVTGGLVVPDENWYGRPRCVQHGAMNRIDPVEYIYRCQMCGVGARWEAAEHTKVPPIEEMYRREVDTESGEHDEIYEFGRSGRWARNEGIEKFLQIWEVTDTDPAYLSAEETPATGSPCTSTSPSRRTGRRCSSTRTACWTPSRRSSGTRSGSRSTRSWNRATMMTLPKW